MRALKPLFLATFLLSVLGSCAFDVVSVKQVPTNLEETAASRSSFELGEEVQLELPAGYDRVLRKGTQWHFVGMIPQGEVYRTKDQVLTVEASNIHEAYIVVSSGRLVGFYLPVERSFSPLRPVNLPIKEGN